MSNFNGYSGYGSYTYPNYSSDFNRQYGALPNMPTPYNNPMQNYPQNQPSQYNMQQGQPQQNNTNVIRYVNGIEGAKAFLVPPNSTVTLFDSDSNHFFTKITNEQGQAVLKQYEYKEITPQVAPNQAKEAQTVNYISMEDLPKIKAEIMADVKNEIFGKKQTQNQNVEVKKNV